MNQIIIQHAPADDDVIAAALAAVQLCLDAEQPDMADETPQRTVWRAAALVAAQGAPPARGGIASRWGTIDRSVRATRWSAGVLGMFD